MERVFLSLGVNLGNRMHQMEMMFDRLRKILGEPVLFSPVVETEPVGVSEEQPWFYNCVCTGSWNGSPHQLLDACKGIETDLGRTEKGTMRPRSADLDILLFGSVVVREPDLCIPHPALTRRRFCMEGICSLAPDLVHPVFGVTLMALLVTVSPEIAWQRIRVVDTEFSSGEHG